MGSVLNSNGSMSANLFVTGTDTGVGKTRVTRLIMRLLKAEGCSVVGMKPVAAGAELLGGRLVNEDALALLEEGSKCSSGFTQYRC
jgi:dethiobiotin synthetase